MSDRLLVSEDVIGSPGNVLGTLMDRETLGGRPAFSFIQGLLLALYEPEYARALVMGIRPDMADMGRESNRHLVQSLPIQGFICE